MTFHQRATTDFWRAHELKKTANSNASPTLKSTTRWMRGSFGLLICLAAALAPGQCFLACRGGILAARTSARPRANGASLLMQEKVRRVLVTGANKVRGLDQGCLLSPPI
jgi:hypothetical protein